jgi:hypothetical protein
MVSNQLCTCISIIATCILSNSSLFRSGLTSRAGIIPISSTQDSAGPMAKSAYDVAMLLTIIAGFDARDTASKLIPNQFLCSIYFILSSYSHILVLAIITASLTIESLHSMRQLKAR